MSNDLERVQAALEELMGRFKVFQYAISQSSDLAPFVLAAIRAAAEADFDWGNHPLQKPYKTCDQYVLDAALAALTDHPGGTDK